MSFKSDILNLLYPTFGEVIKKIIEEHYSEDDPSELYMLTYHMLSGLIGKEYAEKELDKIIKKNHMEYLKTK